MMRVLVFVVAMLAALPALAVNIPGPYAKNKSPFPIYSDTRVSVFGGITKNSYKLGDKHGATLRFDHASAWTYGDNYFFFDIFNPTHEGTTIYSEWVSRLSLGRMMGHPVGFGPIQDFSLAGEINTSGTGLSVYQYGLGVDFDVPHFDFFNVLFLVRDNPAQRGVTYNISPYWRLPFSLGEFDFTFQGFADIVGHEENLRPKVLTIPELLVDVAKFWGSPGTLFAGVRHTYRSQKFGVRGVRESVTEGILTWRFA